MSTNNLGKYLSNAGDLAHNVIEWIWKASLEGKGLKVNIEIEIREIDPSVERAFRIDLYIKDPRVILTNPLLKALIPNPENIKHLVFDFSMAEAKFIAQKLDKRYQGADRFFFIVLYGRNDQLLEVQNEIDKRIDDVDTRYMENIAVITDDICNEMLGLDGEWLDLYKEFDGIIHQLYS